MTRYELQQIADYVRKCEQTLDDNEFDNAAMQNKLAPLYNVIVKLMKASEKSGDSDERTLYAAVEYKARLCRNRMLELTAVRN